MRYWWVNQNQTYKAEFSGGYLWSPKRNKNGVRNQFYENMRSVAPCDLVLSFRDTQIVAIGRVNSYCYDAAKPKEFGPSGANWDQAGWMVDVQYSEVASPIRPKSFIDRIRPLLPKKYSPLQQTGDGLQSVYLAELPDDLATLLLELLREAGNRVQVEPLPENNLGNRDKIINQLEDAIESAISNGQQIGATEKDQIVKARRGQGRFRENVQCYEKRCRVTGISHIQFLIASHIKPWRVASNQERLDGENGLLLSPNVDYLFDRGFISFDDEGVLLISPTADTNCLRLMGIPLDAPICMGGFSSKQKEYLSFHRRNVFLEAGKEG